MNKSLTPDFNYPKDVVVNAQSNLKAALKAGDYYSVSQAIIQFGLAKSMISNDYFPEVVSTTEDAINSVNDPFFKSFLFLIEARIFSSYFNSIEYEILNRNNFNAAPSADYTEWDKLQFQNKVQALVASATSNPDVLIKVPITQYPNLVTVNKNSVSTYPTMLDFFVAQATSILQTFATPNHRRFGARTTNISNNSSDIYSQILYTRDLILKYHPDGSIPFINEIVESESNKKGTDWKGLYSKYADNPNCALILQKYLTTISDDKEKYALVTNYMSKYPNSPFIALITNEAYHLESKSVSLDFANQFASSDSIKVKFKARNVSAFKLYVFNASSAKNTNSKNEVRSILSAKPVLVKDITLSGAVPFINEESVFLDPLPYGRYVLIADFDDGSKASVLQKNVNSSLRCTTVSDLAYFIVDNNENNAATIHIVNYSTGKPIAGVKASISSERKINSSTSNISDKNGCISIMSDSRLNVSLTNKDDKYFAPFYAYTNSRYDSDRNKLSVEILTDLAIYRPGETVHFSAIAYSTSPSSKTLRPNEWFYVAFFDTNSDSIASVRLKSDDLGRFSHDFIVPSDRMNGEFYFHVRPVASKNNSDYSVKSITVSEYKAPSFYVEFIDAKRVYPSSGLISFTGKAVSYSQIPLSGIPVTINLNKRKWLEAPQLILSQEVTTDEKGFFTISFNAADYCEDENAPGVSDDVWFWFRPFSIYSIEASATDKAGDSQAASSSFTIGSPISIVWNGGSDFAANTDKTVMIPIQVSDFTNSVPTDFKCKYTIFNSDKNPVANGEFSSMNPSIDLKSIASGSYFIQVALADDDEVKTAPQRFFLYRLSDSKAPVETAIWTPSSNLSFRTGEKAVIKVASAFPDTHVYYVVSYNCSKISEGWTKINNGFSDISFKMPNDAKNYTINVDLFSCRFSKTYQHNIRVKSICEEPKAALIINSFRDKITAGSLEKWTLNLSIDGRPAPGAAIILEMYDKAINSLSSNAWRFDPAFVHLYSKNFISDCFSHHSYNYIRSWMHPNLRYIYPSLPEFELYGRDFFFSYSVNDFMCMKSAAPAGANIMMRSAKATASQESAELSEASNDIEADSVAACESDTTPDFGQMSAIQLRSSQVKTALWQPSIVTDDNGNAVIEFNTPDFNTTWLVQAIGYNSDLATASFLKEIVSSKPVMVKPNMPRFLRQGDNASLLASVQNATDSIQSCRVIVEVFNPIDNSIISTKSVDLTLNALSSDSVAIECVTPDSISLIGYRIKASNGTFGDGEQVVVPVLQAISPVIESKPFYIEAGNNNFALQLPSFPKGARITFEYCDNPSWYCITALPSIWNDVNPTASSYAHALFSSLVAKHIADSDPAIAKAVDYWKNNPQDSSLVSMLEKNQDLKISSLLASPWLSDAHKQSLQLSQISQLFNDTRMKELISGFINKLKELQLSDGGFTWFVYPDCSSSDYTTMEVLQIIGKIKALKASADYSDDLDKISAKAVKYLDKRLVYLFNLRKNKLDFSGFSDFAYTRSLFLDVPMSVTVKGLYAKIIPSLRNEWRRMDTPNKAFTAITLANNGDVSSAKSILESIRQFSITKPESGMYWDNLTNGSFRFSSKVAITSVILQAFNLIEPSCSDIDLIRKWLLLEKQTTDWGASSMASDAIYAILSSGTKWLKMSDAPQLSFNSSPFEFSKLDKILGYGKRQIDANAISDNSIIDISRSAAGPAWGAVYCQYSAPMAAINAVAIPELSITKEFIAYPDKVGGMAKSDFKVGDKIQVRVTIKNSRNLEFVNLVDERPACFEPADHVSSYCYRDGLGYYMEVKDAKTNLFFQRIPKGTHIISYDVFVTNTGSFNSGIATIQCQYAPQMVAHSAGSVVLIK